MAGFFDLAPCAEFDTMGVIVMECQTQLIKESYSLRQKSLGKVSIIQRKSLEKVLKIGYTKDTNKEVVACYSEKLSGNL